MNPNQQKPIKQINRFATPIKVDANGNRVDEQPKPQQNGEPVLQAVNPNSGQVINTKPNAFENEKMSKLNTVKTAPKKEHDPTIMIFVTVILIIVALTTAYLCYIFLPKENDFKTSKYSYNDSYSVNSDFRLKRAKSVLLNDGNNITGDITDQLSADFRFVKDKEGNIYVNDKYVTSADIVIPKFVQAGDALFFITKEEREHTSTLYVVDKQGHELLKYFSLDTELGMIMGGTASTIDFQEDFIILHLSRVDGSNVILDSEFGTTNVKDICGINNDVRAAIDVVFSYNGKVINQKTDKPVTIGEYKTSHGLCN